jgi:hypothetical protein
MASDARGAAATAVARKAPMWISPMAGVVVDEHRIEKSLSGSPPTAQDRTDSRRSAQAFLDAAPTSAPVIGFVANERFTIRPDCSLASGFLSLGPLHFRDGAPVGARLARPLSKLRRPGS